MHEERLKALEQRVERLERRANSGNLERRVNFGLTTLLTLFIVLLATEVFIHIL